MPSIPQSLLWISLVVLWLFVLVPMLISKRDAVRRTSDVALATRVLNSGSNARLRRPRPAAGHASDPDWQPSQDDLDEDLDERAEDEPVVRAAVVEAVEERSEDSESGELPLPFDEPALEAVETVEVQAVETADIAESDESDESDEADDEYEYVADSSGLEAASETDLRLADSLSAARERRYESKTAAAVSARKYRFRRRMLMAMAATLIASVVAAYLVAPALWWMCGAIGVVTVLYLGYLRRQTRIEERLRRRRAQRMARSRLGVENTDDREFDVVPSRLRRPGSVVLEIDDEDPIFEHLDYAPFARGFDLPRAAGQ
ncbi:divisome protein SepX/GlpR [Mycobacterium deserti]|uniref:Transmembrane protein n=1 Tax=Mycobacterium deserti TaxID=2978347 RepID=A0ABT2M545_9MYCO|nr:gephyrin-like molybdotransferase receptor GlpR [Mycobacterium deserti]MCT7657379.1 hypothetical protein [Mycobacterium deserti]